MVQFATVAFYDSGSPPDVFPPITYLHISRPRHCIVPPVFLQRSILTRKRGGKISASGVEAYRKITHTLYRFALALTVPRTLIPGVGWRSYPEEAESADVDGAGYDSESGSDVG